MHIFWIGCFLKTFRNFGLFVILASSIGLFCGNDSEFMQGPQKIEHKYLDCLVCKKLIHSFQKSHTDYLCSACFNKLKLPTQENFGVSLTTLCSTCFNSTVESPSSQNTTEFSFDDIFGEY